MSGAADHCREVTWSLIVVSAKKIIQLREDIYKRLHVITINISWLSTQPYLLHK